MKPGNFPLSIYRGDTGRWQFKLWNDTAKTVPIDLAGVTAWAEIRDKPGGKKLAILTCVVTQPNIIDMTLPATESMKLPVAAACSPSGSTGASGVWDLQLNYENQDVMTLLAGPVGVTADVTAPEATLYP